MGPALTPRQQQAIEALAMFGDYAKAAAAIGSTYTTFDSLIRGARRRWYRWWHEGETPPSRPWRKDVRANKPLDVRGKPRLTASQVDAARARYHDGEKLRAVAADMGVPVSTLSALIRGTRTPAPDTAGAAA